MPLRQCYLPISPVSMSRCCHVAIDNTAIRYVHIFFYHSAQAAIQIHINSCIANIAYR